MPLARRKSRMPSESGRPRPQQRSVARIVAAAILGLAGAAAILSSLDDYELFASTSSSPSPAGRSLLANETRREAKAKKCGYDGPRLFVSQSEIEPTVAASYPGSGARMTWMLVEALTGQVTGDDWNTMGQADRVVTQKTHYPHPMGKKRAWPRRFPRAILLIRNPADSIPSFFNFLHEARHMKETHSVRAPEFLWLKWRDSNNVTDKFLQKGGFERILANWVDFVKYWVVSYPEEGKDRLTLAFEDIIDDGEGANTAADLAGFLKKAKGVNMVPDGTIECAWHRIVKGKDSKNSLRKGKRWARSYTREQLDMMLEALDNLMKEYKGEKTLVHILERYRAEVAQRPAEDEEKAEVDKSANTSKRKFGVASKISQWAASMF